MLEIQIQCFINKGRISKSYVTCPEFPRQVVTQLGIEPWCTGFCGLLLHSISYTVSCWSVGTMLAHLSLLIQFLAQCLAHSTEGKERKKLLMVES